MAFDARYRETQRGGFGSGAASTEPQPPVETENGAGAVSWSNQLLLATTYLSIVCV